MNKRLSAKASISINASVGKVWDALTDPEVIRQYMFGTNVISDWKEKSPIVWKGDIASARNATSPINIFPLYLGENTI